ncbi:hypothetical protein [Actinokineospora cianjurensis]|uniref:Mce-associated membrane protein n=1 Tax=Actinokineospora cianjurensis TaxID=585224 RepID=A0A421B1Z4_9PSEU|nr:hypothetical protein [Actinokineospora cianjurensis]RLK58362.1 hypothetical protein CLV68_4460 [Actinokineospora cianjurensis]
MSPRRLALSLVVVFTTFVAACTTHPPGSNPGLVTDTVPDTAASSRTRTPGQAPSAGLEVPTATPVVPSLLLPTPSTVPAEPPPADVSPATFRDPVAVARAWMTQWCAGDYREPRNGNVLRAAVFATEPAVVEDLARGDTEPGYRETVRQRLSARCDRFTAEVSPEAPATPERVFVVLTASRTRLAAGQALQVEPVALIRAVVRGPDGRWSVGTRVEAG